MTRDKIGILEDFLPGTMKGLTLQGQEYLICNVDGSIYAIDGLCPHAKGRIAEGKLVGSVIVCPKHGAEFDVKTGKNLKKPHIPFAKASDIRSYKVSIEGNGVFIDH